ncbi:MAG TPA: ABC transporter ATP-binding protein [Flavobacteriales bacterium]|nr:ABC transporter ATP-binding protein [Flavobacteriales bacterium]
MSALLHIEGLSIGFSGRELLRGASFELHAGETMALIGLNGTGKSTLLRTLAGLHVPSAGRVLLNGRPLHEMTNAERARQLSVVFTGKPEAGLLDVRTLVSLGRQPWTGSLGRLSAKDNARVDEAMDHAGVKGFAQRSLRSLSDGEGQKVMIACALAQDTPVMLLDEPTAFLDLVNRIAVMRLLVRIAKEQERGILFSTHDLAMAMQVCDRILLLHDGALWCGTPAEAVSSGVLDRAFASQGLRFDAVTATLVNV